MGYYILLSLFLGVILILKQVDDYKLQDFLAEIRLPVIVGIFLMLIWSVSLVFTCPMEWLEVYVLNTFLDAIMLISLFVAYNHSWEYWQSLSRFFHVSCTFLGAVKVLSSIVFGGSLLLMYLGL